MERNIRTKRRRQNDRSMLSGPANDSVLAGQVQAMEASESEAARSTLRFILRFFCHCSIRERDTMGWMRLAGWEQMERGHFWVGIP